MAVTVETKERSVLQPSPESARGGGKKVPLTVFDLASPDGYIPAAFAWYAPAPTNGKLKEGLLAAIARFPHLAGRFTIDEHGRKCIQLNDAGVLVLEATADADLADALAADDVSVHINQLYPKAHKEHAGEPIFQVQLTRYKCGGLVIGTACHHQVADGQAMNIFYTAWATAVRTHLVVLPSPFIDRSASVVPRAVPTPVFDHGNIEFMGERTSRGVLPMESIKNLVVHFPGEFVAELKARVGTGGTTFQCLLAHAWKKVTAARGLAPDDFSHVRVAVNCRGRAKPPMPMDFFGNMVLWAFPRMQVSDLLSSSYLAVVGVVRDAVAAVDDDYVQSFVDFGEVDRRGIGEELASTTPTPGMALSPHLEVDSWLGLRFNDLNFGFGPPCAVLPPDLPIEGLMIFVPSCAVKGGVDLFMALDEKHVNAFKQICYSLD